MSDRPGRVRRRRLLAATAGFVGLAGCSGGDDDSGTETPPPDQTGTPGLTANDITGLSLWLGPGSEIDEAEGGVSAWRDQSDSGNDLTQSTAERQPRLAPDAADGRRALRFDGDGDHLLRDDTLGIGAESPRTFVVVSRLTETAARSPALMQGLFDSGGAGSSFYGLEANTFNTAGERFGLYLVSVAKDSERATDTAYHVHVLQTEGFPVLDEMESSTRYFVGGEQVPFGDTQGGARNSPFEADTTAVGSFPVSAPERTFAGEVAEVRVYDRSLPEDERTVLTTHLLDKYGLDGA